MTDSLEELTGRLRAFAAARDWEQFHTPKNLAMALSVEVAELMEIFQWLTPEESAAVMSGDRADDVRDELADVLIYLTRLADILDVDVVAEAERKTRINEERFPVTQPASAGDGPGALPRPDPDAHLAMELRRLLPIWLPPSIHPEGALAPVDGRHVGGVAAFPVSTGLLSWDEDELPPFPFGGVMAVGNTPDSVANVERRIASGVAHGSEEPGSMGFWKTFLPLVDGADGVRREDVFVTNVHPALVTGESNTGRVDPKAPNYGAWSERAAAFLSLQIETMRPRVLLLMGGAARDFVGRHVLETRVPKGPAVVEATVGDHELHVGVVHHPSAYQHTFADREFNGRTGRNADAAVLERAWMQSTGAAA